MIGSKTQCRYCSYFRYGEIIVIDTTMGYEISYDGQCVYDCRKYGIIPVNLSDDCPNFKSRMEGVKK